MNSPDFEQPDLFGIVSQPPAVIERPCHCCRGTGVLRTTGPIEAVTARPTDPETSKKAARKENPGHFYDSSVVASILRHLAEHPTSQYIAAKEVCVGAEAQKVQTARRRASQLVQAGYARFIEQTVINPDDGGEAFVMVVTEQGRRAIERLNATGRSW